MRNGPTADQEAARLRALGVRIAIDDAGAGYASMRHILSIEPDLIKLDMSLTRGIDQDRKRRALASALIAFAHETRIDIVAEGVETAAELDTLRELGVRKVQGYFLARPGPPTPRGASRQGHSASPEGRSASCRCPRRRPAQYPTARPFSLRASLAPNLSPVARSTAIHSASPPTSGGVTWLPAA
jgi:predicted signal transduction protein with EAL and GGDEF domain